MAVESIDEFGAKPPEQQARNRHAHHFLLDYESEARR